jgi:MoaA/NifB/PqqE/SkfB family radical SAM enzyme
MSDLHDHEFNPLKVLHHIDRLKVLARGGDTAPVTVEIDPVAYCNHTCAWCVDPIHRPVAMSVGTFHALVDELAGWSFNGFSVQGIVLKGGGEPTLHPAFDRLVEHAVDSGFAVGVITNGSRLPEWAEVLATRATYVRVSIDGPTPESHAMVHGSRDFDRILEGTRRLLKLRTSRYPTIGLSFAIDVRTIDLASQAIELGNCLGVDYVLLRPPFFEEVGREATMSVQEAREVRRRLAEAAAQYSGPMLVQVGNWVGDVEQRMAGRALMDAGRRDAQLASTLPIEHRTGRCLASPVLAVVTADGSVYGCCNLRALPQWSFGRVDYERGIGFASIWNGPQRRDVLGRMHRTECIGHCTHPLSRYNEIVEVLRAGEGRHSQFV